MEGDQTYDAHIDVLVRLRARTTRSSRRRVLPGGCVGLWSHPAGLGGGDVEALLAAFGSGGSLVRLAKVGWERRRRL